MLLLLYVRQYLCFARKSRLEEIWESVQFGGDLTGLWDMLGYWMDGRVGGMLGDRLNILFSWTAEEMRYTNDKNRRENTPGSTRKKRLKVYTVSGCILNVFWFRQAREMASL